MATKLCSQCKKDTCFVCEYCNELVGVCSTCGYDHKDVDNGLYCSGCHRIVCLECSGKKEVDVNSPCGDCGNNIYDHENINIKKPCDPMREGRCKTCGCSKYKKKAA